MSLDYRYNRLPQWRLEGGVYHITWRILPERGRLSGPERTIVANAIRFCQDKRYRLGI